MHPFKTLALVFVLVGLVRCKPDDKQPAIIRTFDFNTSTQGWAVDFTDYPVGFDSTIFEFKAGQASLPPKLDGTRKGFRVQSHNRSDDLFTFLKTKLTGLTPNTAYDVQVTVDFGSMYSGDMAGIGGGPGTSVFFKVGALANEPRKIRNGNYFNLNADKGNQSLDGTQAFLVGTASVGDADPGGYVSISRSNDDRPLRATTNDKGELWVFFGTDSGFEGLTVLYYQQVEVGLTPATP